MTGLHLRERGADNRIAVLVHGHSRIDLRGAER